MTYQHSKQYREFTTDIVTKMNKSEIYVKAHIRKVKTKVSPPQTPQITPPSTPRLQLQQPTQIVESKNYLVIQYHEKDDLKDQYPGQLQWDEIAKRWHTDNLEVYNQLEPFHVHVLEVKYKNKDAGKSLGAKWSGKYWYCSKQQYFSKRESFEELAIVK
jgi:hypothetical protein